MKSAICDNKIHPTAVIDTEVRLGKGNYVGAYTIITGNVEVGDGNWIGPHVSIGYPAQFSTKKYELNGSTGSGVVIGSRNVIREYCTVHQPSEDATVIESDCYLMSYCHVSHDTRIRNGAVLANNVQIGGFSEVGERANIGLSAVLHQFSTIGFLAMIGMGTVVTKDIPPFVKAVGNPVRFRGLNTIGMQRFGLSDEQIHMLHEYMSRRGALEMSELSACFSEFTNRTKGTGRQVLVVPGDEN